MNSKRPIGSIAAAVAALAFSAGAAATPVSLGVVTHQYGSGPGHVAPTAFQFQNSCDTLNATSVTVTNKGGCQRFADAFDFSALDFDSVTALKLTLTYSGTANFLELWQAAPAKSYSVAGDTNVTIWWPGSATSSFTFDDSLDIFDEVVDNGMFYLWFRQQGLGQHNFTLTSASLEVIGTPAAAVEVPEPGSLALVAAAGLGLLLAGRRRA